MPTSDLAGISEQCCPKVIVINEEAPDELVAVANLELYLEPDRNAPLLSEVELKNIAENFQVRLLDYRLKNHAAVRTSTFDAPPLDGATREIARTSALASLATPNCRRASSKS